MRLAFASSLVVALGCGAAEPVAPSRAPAIAARPAIGWRVRAPGGLAPIAAGTRDPALLDAGACQRCHPAEHAEWAMSRHGRAWQNGIFRREYRELPRRWCVHCHAPLDVQEDEVVAARAARGRGPAPSTALAEQGVSCAACHVRGGRLHAKTRRPGSPHDTVTSADFGGPTFCADCHQFAFPAFDGAGEVTGLSTQPMQATVAQFAAGPFAARAGGCRSCHADSPAGHAYPGGHDADMVARALDWGVCQRGETLEIALANRGAGHNVPTGDVHRHLVARLWRSSAPEALFEVFIGRRYEPDPAGGKRTTWDSTIPPRTTRRFAIATAALGGEPDEPINFALTYVYTLDETPSRRRDPGEPTALELARERWEVGAVPTCGAQPALE